MLTETIINDAQTIRDNLSRAERDLELAMERDAVARRALTDTKRDYQDAEAEIKFELWHSAAGSNDKLRSAEVDLGLVRARTQGALVPTWRRLLVAQNEAEAATTALEQMKTRYRATETAAEITTAMLRALSR